MSEEFFDAKYRRDGDPWDFAGDPEELARYGAIVELVGEGPFRNAFEPGCSIGELTRLLAPCCRRLLAIDISATAARAAVARCDGLPQVHVCHADLADGVPDEQFDLIVFSEIGYYFTRRRLAALIEALVDGLDDGGRLVAAHWTGHSGDHVLAGEAVHDVIDGCARLERRVAETHPRYVLGMWERPRT